MSMAASTSSGSSGVWSSGGNVTFTQTPIWTWVAIGLATVALIFVLLKGRR